ncbi:MAG: type 1 glutamine amidotransferase [Oligoflexia bacterium]
MKVLLIDNTRDPDSWGSGELRRTLSAPDGKPAGIALRTHRAPHRDFPKNLAEFDRIVLSGSATSATEDALWIENLLELIRSAVTNRIPILGICYGHQSLARALAGKNSVRRAQAPEIGWTQIQKTGSSQSPLLQGLPSEFYSFSMHYDEVCKLPQGTRLLASSQLCPIQAFELDSAPAFGVQFHPERDLKGAAHTFALKQKLNPPPPLLHPHRQDLHDPQVATVLIQNFYRLKT